MKGEKKSQPGRVPETKFPARISFEGERARVTVDLLGIGEEKVRIDLDESLVISATEGRRRFRTALELPWEARLGSKSFRKGILELVVERAGG